MKIKHPNLPISYITIKPNRCFQMTTVYTILLLVLIGIVLGFIVMVVLPLSGFLGEWVAGVPGNRSKLRLTIGVTVASIFQTYFYLSFVAFVISWTSYRLQPEQFSNYIVWTFAFASALLPLWFGSAMMRVQHKEKNTGLLSATAEATKLTCFLATIGFFVFVYTSGIMSTLWSWVPYVE